MIISILALLIASAGVYALLMLIAAIYKLTAAVTLADENAMACAEETKNELHHLRYTLENESSRWMNR